MAAGFVDPVELFMWCRVPVGELVEHPERRLPLRLCADSTEMGRLMARELVDEIIRSGGDLRLIVPCGPSGWYRPFTELVNAERVSLAGLEVFHMDECLDWQGKPLPRSHPYSFRGFMERHFYGPVDADLNVPGERRHWPEPGNLAG